MSLPPAGSFEGAPHSQEPEARFMSINSLDDYKNTSFEELRVEHYASNLVARVPELANGHAAVTWPLASTMNPSDEQATIGMSLDPDVIHFSVGVDDNAKLLGINADLILARSEFVRLAMKDEWKEATERLISLREDDPASFLIYQQWLYSGVIFSGTRHGEEDREYEILVKAYFIGEKFVDGDFQDTIIGAIINKLLRSRCFNIRLTGIVCENTSSNSPLRRLWLDIYYYSGGIDWVDEKSVDGEIDAEFLYDYCRYQVGNRSGLVVHGPAYVNNPCHYHKHANGVCYLTKRLSLTAPPAYIAALG